MKEHATKFWLHYLILGICVFFIIKLYSDNITGGNGNIAPVLDSNNNMTSLDYNKILSTGNAYSAEVKAAQAYINMHMNLPAVQNNPLNEDGILGINTSIIISALQACNSGSGGAETSVSISLSEVISYTDNYNCAP